MPDVLNKLASNYYNLYIQKQPGSDVNQVAVDANFLNDIKSYSPAVLHAEKVNSSRIKWETDLNMDKSFNVSF